MIGNDERLTFVSVDPFAGMTPESPGIVLNLVGGQWGSSAKSRDDIVDPMTGLRFLEVPDTNDFDAFMHGLSTCPKSGLHNPIKNPHRQVALGQVCARAAAALATPDVERYFARLIQRVMPKSWEQCVGEVVVTRVFLENFAGDGVRFLSRGFLVPGDHAGQMSQGYRWPFGPVAVIAPFNFPLEIPALQACGALFMGNRPLVKIDSKVSVVFEQFLRLLIQCGLEPSDVDLIHCRGTRMGELLHAARDDIRLAQFTGSSEVAEKVSQTLNGRVRIEDAGFDWKVIGPDFDESWLDYVAWQSDKDAYDASGQKCSAQSILFVHKNWADALIPKLKELASKRSLDDLTIGPVLSWSNDQIHQHIEAVLAVPGAKLLFGGEQLQNHDFPVCFGAFQPTAVEVPLTQCRGVNLDVITKELFGPFQIVVRYADDDIGSVLGILESMSHHLTAAVVSADVEFQNRVLGATVNGTTYCGMRARTTGAPQNHWFGPSGDPRGAGIGTPEAITSTWSGHREVVFDQGPIPEDWR